MKQICKFNTKPATINNGGYKKGRWVVWLNLGVSEIEQPEEPNSEHYQGITDRLVLLDNSISAFLEVVDPTHIAMATAEEVYAILCYFQSEHILESWKDIRKVQIQGYDCSENVNCFYLNGIPLWLDKSTRVGLVNSITIEKKAKRTTTCLWFGSHHISMDVDMALDALFQLELYALNCYNITAQHLVYIEQCQLISELERFDIYADYPDMLQFSTK